MTHRGEAREVADTDTGEALWLAERKRPGHVFRPDSEGRAYMLIGALASENIEGSSYDGTTIRLLLRCSRLYGSTGLIRESQTKLAKALGCSQATISRSMNKLRADGHFYQEGKNWFINPETSFTGSGQKHQEAMAHVPAESRLLAVVKPIRDDEGYGE